MQPTPPQAPNPATSFLTRTRVVPTWGLILGILLACSLGFAVHPSGGATTTVTTGSTTTAVHTPVATHAPAATPTPKPTAGPLASFSGNSNQTTGNFTVTSDQWTITWTCTGDPNAVFAVNVYASDGTILYPSAVNPPCASDQSGSTIEHGAGTFYLDIGAVFTTWTVIITQ